MTARFHRFGRLIHRWRTPVIAAWAVLLLVGGLAASQAHLVLKGGAGGIPGGTSEHAVRLLHEHFDNPYQYSFIVTVSSETESLDGERLPRVVQELQEAAASLPATARTFSWLDRAEDFLRSPDGKQTFFVMGLRAKDNLAAEDQVAPTRAALAPVIARWQRVDPSLRVYVTGETPIGYDGTQVLRADTATAEKRILPLAALFLLVAFGGLAASGVPVLMGAVASVLTLGLLYGFGHVMNLSALAQNISTMVGLGVGIDYSLIMVSRYREALARGLDTEEAVAETVATAGQAVFYSGLTVVIGFLALFLPRLIETTSLALAGSLTVFVTVLLATTLLPAVLGVLGPRVDWPFRLSRWVSGFERRVVAPFWYGWAQKVMRYPARFLVTGTLILLALAAPAFTVQFGQISTKFLPTGMESGSGLVELERMKQAGELYPIQVVIRHGDGTHVFSAAGMKAVAGVVRELRGAPEVAEVRSILDNASQLLLLNNLFFSGDVGALRKRFPEAASLLISQDGSGTVIQVIPRSGASFAAIKAFTRGLQDRDWSQVPGLANAEVAIGGAAAVNNDFERAILEAMPKVVALVFLVTFGLLYLSFRSVVLPLKALAMNTLSVLASFGALVLVFQHGIGGSLLGFAEAPGLILVPVPIIVFCAVFGLSMDYEVFLLSRIKEEYDDCGDNRQAVARGLSATGGIITNAALIMLLVFGAFIAADVILTKMIGFGLAVAVLIDALIIRVMLVPSFMALVGDWNWWPNVKSRLPDPRLPVGTGRG